MERGERGDHAEARPVESSEIMSSSERSALLEKLTAATDKARERESSNNDRELLTPEQIDRLREIPGLRPGEWADRNLEQRKETLVELENRLAEIQGRPPAEMEFVPYTNGRIYGEYRPDENKILVNVDYVRADLHPSESVNTVAHEGRHAYQSFALNNEGFHRDAAEVERWRANDKKYLSIDKYGERRYREQPLEADAWPYGEYVAERLTTEQHNLKEAR